jgi:MFS transporter, PPP family, 3-phenylpropionic acid transporter
MSSRLFTLRLSAFNAFLFIGSGIQMPFLPLWLKDKALSEAEIALVMALMMAIRILAMPVGTALADVIGNRRTVIMSAAFASFAAYMLLHFMSGFWPILIVAMTAAALLSPVVPLAEALSLEGSAHYGVDYGRIRMWASVSFLAGSLTAGALLEIIPVDMVIVLIAAAQGVGALMTLVLPNDRALKKVRSAKPFSLKAVLAFAATGTFFIFLASSGIGQSSHGLLYAMGSVHFDTLGYSKLTIGELWAASVITEIVMFAFARHFHKWFGSVQLIVIGTGIAVLRWAVMALEPPLAMLFVIQMLHAATFGFTHLGTMHYIREKAPDHMRNSVQGIYSALSSGVLMSATMWSSGLLYAAFGGAAFFVMAAVAAIAFGLALTLRALSPRDP